MKFEFQISIFDSKYVPGNIGDIIILKNVHCLSEIQVSLGVLYIFPKSWQPYLQISSVSCFEKMAWLPPCLLAADAKGWLRFPTCSPVASTSPSQAVYWGAFPSSQFGCQLFLMSYTPRYSRLKESSLWGETLRERETKRAPLKRDGKKS